MTLGLRTIGRRDRPHLLSKILVAALIPVFASAQARADDIDLAVSVAPKNIRSGNVTEKSRFFRSIGLPAFADALTVVSARGDRAFTATVIEFRTIRLSRSERNSNMSVAPGTRSPWLG